MEDTFRGIRENLIFLTAEVKGQLEQCEAYLSNPSPEDYQRITRRDDYIDGLTSIVARKCFEALHVAAPKDEASVVQRCQAWDTIAHNLEQIADHCESFVGQVSHLNSVLATKPYQFEAYFKKLKDAIPLIQTVVKEFNLEAGLRLSEIEKEIDDLYAQAFLTATKALKNSDAPNDEMTCLFMAHYLERMGDKVLNIGEAVLSASLGEKIKIHDYQAIRSTLYDIEHHLDDADMSVKRLAETKSGSKIEKIDLDTQERSVQVVYKDGAPQKVLQEKEGIERWERNFPGIVPRVFSFQKQKNKSSILFEFIEGVTFERILLNGTEEDLKDASQRLNDLLWEIWRKTSQKSDMSSGFVTQLEKRLETVFSVHPRFKMKDQKIKGKAIPTLVDLVDRAAEVEKTILAPVSVFGHGDFNLDNILFAEDRQRIRFVDVHRSKQQDYMQDVTVFLASNYRIPTLDTKIRERITGTILFFESQARRFADEVDDEYYELRLALGLARSFISSTRFVLDKRLAERMRMKGVFLLQTIAETELADLRNYTFDRTIFVA